MTADDRIKIAETLFKDDEDALKQFHGNYYLYIATNNEFAVSIFINYTNFCGCGCLEYMTIPLIRDCLNCFEDRENLSPYLELSKLKERLKSDEFVDFILHFLSFKELTEHGGSVYGSWLTDRGRAMREVLNIFQEEE